MPGHPRGAATPDHPSFPSARSSQAVLRYFRRRVEALAFLSLPAGKEDGEDPLITLRRVSTLLSARNRELRAEHYVLRNR